MIVTHFSYASDGGAGRAGRRAHAACRAVGMSSTFLCLTGESTDPTEIVLPQPSKPGKTASAMLSTALMDRVQWQLIPGQRTPLSDTLLSIPYPGAHLVQHRLLTAADIIHLHWPTWGITPNTLATWLDAGRRIFWTLHDYWPMTGGCHYPAGCEQYRTACIKCPQLRDDHGLIANGFAEKLLSYQARGALHLVAPSQWMARIAQHSAIFRDRPLSVVRNPVELEVFTPREDRQELRRAFGIEAEDLVLVFGHHGLSEGRKGGRLLAQALRDLASTGELSRSLSGARIHVATFGDATDLADLGGVFPIHFGQIDSDAVVADILGMADLTCVPSLEDNYPNLIVESLACGTPCLITPVGGMTEMVVDGDTGVVTEAASVSALKDAVLRFAREHHGCDAMRTRCRSAAERDNDPVVIGRQLESLYGGATGRTATPNPQIQARMARALAGSPVSADPRCGGEFLRFPVNLLVRDRVADPASVRSITADGRNTPAGPGRTRLLTVRTHHEHHSAHSGPYQFIRHLPRLQYDASHCAVPLGSELAGEMQHHYRKAGLLLGLKAFAPQGNAWLAEAEVLAEAAAQKIDIVHYIDGELTGWLLAMTPRELFHDKIRPKLVVTYHQPPALLQTMVSRELLKRYDAVIALCKTQLTFLERYVDPQRLLLIPHGIDTTFFRPAPAALRQHGPFRMLLVGHWLRDLPLAFAVFESLLAGGLDLELTVISPRLPDRQRHARLIHRSGLTDAELRDAYWSADVLFLPLKDATANNAVLEAMACGLPVISTDVGGVADAVGPDAGILCPPGDAQAFATAIRTLASDANARSAMASAGRRRAEALDWSAIGRMHHDLYSNLMQTQWE